MAAMKTMMIKKTADVCLADVDDSIDNDDDIFDNKDYDHQEKM